MVFSARKFSVQRKTGNALVASTKGFDLKASSVNDVELK